MSDLGPVTTVTTPRERASGRSRSSIVELGAFEIATLIRERTLSCVEVTDAFIARCEEVNPALNALVVPLFDDARRAAKDADRALADGKPIGALHGVPVTIKEEFHVSGTPTTLGLPSQKRGPFPDDGPLVRRLRNAGAIVLGKTNVSQLLIFHEADNPVYGRTNNPWNLGRSSGGSSGGEAALVAARGSPLGLGSDLGGSLRVPAHFCGVCSFKPTSGRLTKIGMGVVGLAAAQEGLVPQAGPIARNVADLALAMRVLAAPGQEHVDPTVAPVAWSTVEISPSALRVGVFTADGHFPAQPAIRRAVEEAAAALTAAGAKVTSWTPPPTSEALRLFVGLLSSDDFASFRRGTSTDPIDRRVSGLFTLSSLPRALRPFLAGVARLAGQRRLATTIGNSGKRSAAEYFDLLAARNAFRERFFSEMNAAELDVIVCPPHALPALPHGASEFLFESASYSILFNVLGMPAGVVAATRVREGEESDRPASRDMVEKAAKRVEAGSVGLPLGVQVAARVWREDLVLATMSVLEAHFRANADFPRTPAATT